MSTIDIRPVEPSDEEDWRRLWTLYLDFYESSVGEEVYQATWQRLFSGADNEYRGLLAIDGDRAVGLAHYLFHRHCWRIENVCYLQDLVVQPDRRGKGIGRALIEGVYAAADDARCPYVYWTTQDFNEVGRHLYDRVGRLTPFVKYER